MDCLRQYESATVPVPSHSVGSALGLAKRVWQIPAAEIAKRRVRAILFVQQLLCHNPLSAGLSRYSHLHYRPLERQGLG
jgi:hypothetical protein